MPEQRYDVVRKEGARDGDSRSSVTGAGRGWRGVPGAGRSPTGRAAGALLADLRIVRLRRRGRQETCLAQQSISQVPEGCFAAHLAVRSLPTRCLNARGNGAVREWDMSQFEAPVPTPRDEPVWLQPFPDAFLEGAADRPLGLEARYEQTEAISLAFVTALQLLPPRQLAVLILRDVLGFHASEVASMLEVTIEIGQRRANGPANWPAATPPAVGQQALSAASAGWPPRTRSWPCSPRRGVGRSRRAGGPTADRRRLHRYASEPFGYEGRDIVSATGPPVRRGPVRPRADPSQQPARVRGMPAPGRNRHATGFCVCPGGDRITRHVRFEASVLLRGSNYRDRSPAR